MNCGVAMTMRPMPEPMGPKSCKAAATKSPKSWVPKNSGVAKPRRPKPKLQPWVPKNCEASSHMAEQQPGVSPTGH